MKTSPCRLCGRPILLVRDANTHNIRPVDVAATLNCPGHIVMIGHGDQQECIQLTSADIADGRRRYTHMPHQATCSSRSDSLSRSA